MKPVHRWIDIGVNLTDPMFRGMYHGRQIHNDDLSLVLERAWQAGMEKMIVTGGSLEESQAAFDMAQSDPRLYCTVGVHPTRTNEWAQSAHPDEYWSRLREFLTKRMASGKIVAIGEFGLDYDRLQFSDKEIQKQYFEKQFSLAQEFRLPLFLHSRNCFDDFYGILERNRHLFNKGVVHSFTGSHDEAMAYIHMGLYIGLNGCSFKTQENINVIQALPLEYLMIETDAPWCEIRPTHAGYQFIKSSEYKKVAKEKFIPGMSVKGRNEPWTISQVAEAISQIKGIPLDTVSQAIHDNTMRVFFSVNNGSLD